MKTRLVVSEILENMCGERAVFDNTGLDVGGRGWKANANLSALCLAYHTRFIRCLFYVKLCTNGSNSKEEEIKE